MRFEHILLEGDTSDATNMEKVIVDFFNGGDGLKKKYSHLNEVGHAAYLDLMGKVISPNGGADHMGARGKKSDLSNTWRDYGGTDGTPKTDFLIGRDQISLKASGGSQLMSAKKGESEATFKVAAENSNISKDEIANVIENYLSNMASVQSPAGVEDTRGVKNHPMGSYITEIDKIHKQIEKHFKQMFEYNPSFKTAMVFEAMTGSVKFGDSNPNRANRIYVYDKAGTVTYGDNGQVLSHSANSSWHNIDNNGQYTAEKASHTKIVIGWKSAGRVKKGHKTGEYNIWSSFRLSEEIQQGVNEGVMDAIVRAKNWVKSQWKKVKKWLMKSWDNILTFLGLIPTITMGPTTF